MLESIFDAIWLILWQPEPAPEVYRAKHMVSAPKAQKPGLTSVMSDANTNTWGFTDKPFFEKDSAAVPELTERDIYELKERKLNPAKAHYAAAKRMFASNPSVTKTDLAEAIPGVSIDTWKDVLASFRAALKESAFS